MKSAARITVWFWQHFGGTVQLAQLTIDIRTELERRAEYAARFQIHSPTQWWTRLLRRRGI